MTASCSCGAAWSGTRIAHCGNCHRTFGSVAAFDRHRVNFTCRDPESRGMVRDGTGRWVTKLRDPTTLHRRDSPGPNPGPEGEDAGGDQ